MELIRSGEHSFGHRMRAGEDKIVLQEIKLLNCKRHDREKAPIVAPDAWYLLEKGRADGAVSQESALSRWNVVDQAEQVRVGIDGQHLFQHALGTRVGHQPIVDDGDFHELTT